MIDFFKESCQQHSTASSFWLADDVEGAPAYISNQGIAKVINESELSICFTAIDKCVMCDQENSGEFRCDVMLHTHEHLYFVELKDQMRNWQPRAIQQLSSTIERFKESHPDQIDKYRHKKAFAANKKHPGFHIIDHETNKRFFKDHGFRIDIQAEVVIV